MAVATLPTAGATLCHHPGQLSAQVSAATRAAQPEAENMHEQLRHREPDTGREAHARDFSPPTPSPSPPARDDMAEALGVASSVIAVIEISGRVANLCYKYIKGVKNAQDDVNRVLREVNLLIETTNGLKEMLAGSSGDRLRTSQKIRDALDPALAQIVKLENDLHLSSRRQAFKKLGVAALTWPLKSKDVAKVTEELNRSTQAISLALQVDQTSIMLNLDQKAALTRLPVAAGAAYNSFAEDGNPTCLENTRVSILKELEQWADDENAEPMFWLNGMAGTGKSTIARTIARRLNQSGHLGASFFFKRGEEDRDGLRKFFSTMSAQLLKSVPPTASHIQRAIDEDPEIFQKSMHEQFDKLVLQPLSKADSAARKPATLVILIDALDECGSSHGDMRRVIGMLSRARAAVPTPRIQMLVTSRPELPIRLGFSLVDSRVRNVPLQELPDEVVEQDIATYLKHELTGIRVDYNARVTPDRYLSKEWPGRDKIDSLVNMAVPLFIFAATVCRFVGDMRWHPEGQLEKILRQKTRSQQSKLDANYRPVLDPLLDGLDKAERTEMLMQFRSVVGPITVLRRPLSVNSLARLLALPKRLIQDRLDGLHSVLNVPPSPDVPVRPLHLSFRDFLVDANKEGDDPFWINEKKTHKKLAECCIEIMNSCLKMDICNLKAPGATVSSVDRDRINNALPDQVQYACVNWVWHLEEADVTLTDNDATHLFLKTHLSHWLETLSLIGSVQHAMDMTTTLQSQVDASKASEMTTLLDDIQRILFLNAPTIHSYPLQVYSSTLMFAPQKSVVKELFRHEVPSWISFLPHVDKDWDEGLHSLDGHKDSVACVAFANTGRLLASGSRDCTVRIWNADKSSCLHLLEAGSCVESVAFSHDSCWVVAGLANGMVKIWDLDTDACVMDLQAHSDAVKSVDLSHDSKRLLTSSTKAATKLWSVAERVCLQTILSDRGVAALSHDSTMIVSATNENLYISSAETGKTIHTLSGHRNWVNTAEFSHDSTMVVSGSHDESVRIWSMQTGECIRIINPTLDHVASVKFSRDSSLIVCGTEDRHLSIWNTETAEPVKRIARTGDGIRSVAISNDSKRIASVGKESCVWIWELNLARGESQLIQDHVLYIHFSDDGEYAVSSTWDEHFNVYSLKTGEMTHRMPTSRPDLGGRSKFLPHSHLFLADVEKPFLWDVAKGRKVADLPVYKQSTYFTTSHDGRMLYRLSTEEGVAKVRRHNSETGDLMTERAYNVGNKKHVNFLSAFSNWLAIRLDEDIKLLDCETGEEHHTISGVAKGLCITSASRSAPMLATGSEKAVSIWDETFRLVGQLSLTSRIECLAFSGDSKFLAVTCLDKTLTVWDTASSVCIRSAPLPDYGGRIQFSKDNLHVLTKWGYIRAMESLDGAKPTPMFVGVGRADPSWITWNDEKLIWLPAQYRGTPSAVVNCCAILPTNLSFVTAVSLRKEKLQ